jgi:hypothetical protein
MDNTSQTRSWSNVGIPVKGFLVGIEMVSFRHICIFFFTVSYGEVPVIISATTERATNYNHFQSVSASE